jgi:hypothetical protein
MTVRIAQFGSDGLPPGNRAPAPALDPPGQPLPPASPASATPFTAGVEGGADDGPEAEHREMDRRESDRRDVERREAERRAEVSDGDAATVGDDAPIAEGRRALRAERQDRRRLAVACALVIAVCLVVTILIVGLARSRNPGALAPLMDVTVIATR